MSGATATATATRTGSYKELLVERREGLWIIRFNRPAVLNALRRRTIYELLRALEAGNADPQVSVIVLTGSAAAFSSGNDLADVAAQQRAGAEALEQYLVGANYVLSSLVKKMALGRKITVALVQGVCVGIGVTLCALCDIVYATESAQFWTPFSQLGLCAEAGSSWTLPHILGRSKAAELLLFGAKMDAATALRHNFVAGVLRDDQLEAEFWQRMAEYSRLPTVSLRATKRLLQRPWRPQLLIALRDELAELQHLRRGATYRTQLTAFARRANIKQSSKL